MAQPQTDNDLHETPSHPSQPSEASPAEEKPTMEPNPAPSTPPKKNKLTFKSLWAKTGLNTTLAILIFKGSVAPVLFTAMFQSNAVANSVGSLGYLAAIISILSTPFMPRAKFVQGMILLIITLCFAVSVMLLQAYCAVKAREHTSRLGPMPKTTSSKGLMITDAPYNSSASAVSAIWLFLEIYFAHALRAKNDMLRMPSIVMSIVANVGSVYIPFFISMKEAETFAVSLLKGFLMGFAISTAVSLFVFPITLRTAIFKQMAGYIMVYQGALKAHIAYVQSLREDDMLARTRTGGPGSSPRSPPALAFKGMVDKLAAMLGKLAMDVKVAQNEIAVGKLDAGEVKSLHKQLRVLFFPLLSLSSTIGIFERHAGQFGYQHLQNSKPFGDDPEDPREKRRQEKLDDWHALMTLLAEPFANVTSQLNEALTHVLYRLQLAKPPKSKTAAAGQAELANGRPQPGDDAFAEYIIARIKDFQTGRREIMERYCVQRGFKIPPGFFDDPQVKDFEKPDWYSRDGAFNTRREYRRQLYVVLYMDFLLGTIGHQVQNFVLWTENLVASGRLSRKRLIYPKFKHIRKWFMSLFHHKEDHFAAHDHALGERSPSSVSVYVGDAFQNPKKDPEHLPPTNFGQRVGNFIRCIPKIMHSPASLFGLRAAMATMCIAVIAFLHTTQVFYIKHRLFWAQIMIAMSMNPSSGESILQFAMRLLGSAFGMAASYAVYYMVVGHTAGVIVFYWVVLLIGFYIMICHMRWFTAGMLSNVTMTLILVYELQVAKIGDALSGVNGQEILPTWELAPIRLLTVIAGLFVAWFWTIFPWPISEHSMIRRSLGAALYMNANFYSIVHEMIRHRVFNDKDLPNFEEVDAKFDKSREKVFVKSLMLQQSIRAHLNFSKFDWRIGGRFPRERYERIIDRMTDVLAFTALMGYASNMLVSMRAHGMEGTSESSSQWLRDFHKLLKKSNLTSRELTSLLALISAAVTSGRPLPPYLKAPDPFRLSDRLEGMDQDILSVRHMAEPGYAAFACMQISTTCIIEDLDSILREVTELVGVLDFSYHVVSTADATPATSQDRLLGEKTD